MVPIILAETKEGFLEASRHKRMERIRIRESSRREGESQAEDTARTKAKRQRNSGFREGQWKKNVLVSLLRCSWSSRVPRTEKDGGWGRIGVRNCSLGDPDSHRQIKLGHGNSSLPQGVLPSTCLLGWWGWAGWEEICLDTWISHGLVKLHKVKWKEAWLAQSKEHVTLLISGL